ncbi:MAG: 2',5' RNA ligase family [Methanoregula sp. PtaU1.Bin051]|nr:MAG: 2',5' RNA ligase family [Methanoregula sp. PtaU1.Bin051]
MVRAFVALELTEEIRAALAEAQEILRGSSARLTFVSPPQIHITVKFLGEVEEKKIGAVIDALKIIPFTPFPVTAGRVTVNNPRRPFTVWCSIDDNGKGAQLVRAIEDSLAHLGFLRETRPFTAHATVARVKRYDHSLMDVLGRIGKNSYGSCMINGLKLKKSTLTSKGPIYEDLLEVNW